ncbi:MAG: tRNA dihydrouridine synthase DusB [Candidatus Omnitrophica bacterium]|nr:tRNA dihydrouridine synthase DusB [Candidatus Omnitrophota bacterium]
MQLGNIKIDNPLLLAPMHEITDAPFRLICKELGADIVFTEFTSCEALIRDIPKALKKINISEQERPIGVQIFGSVEESMELATKKIENLSPDFIDINCGCWTKHHAARGEGAGLLKDLPAFEKIIKAVVRATTLPVTVKTRLGWDEKNIVILEAAKIAEQAGAKALTVHCRTRQQAYKGKADWSWLEKIKKVINIPLIGNGDVVTPQDVKKMFETGCDGVMIGRGALLNPWIFAQTKYYLKTGVFLPEPSLKEKFDLCIRHLKLSIKERGEYLGVTDFRKYYSGYFRDVPNIAKLRIELMSLMDLDKIIERLDLFLKEYSSAKESSSNV